MIDSGIYKIINTVNNNFYIGQSKSIRKRMYNHLSLFSRNKHPNPYFQSAFNKYGEKSFVFEPILYCEIKELTYYEQKLVDLLNPEYNLCRECVDSREGTVVSEETKFRISKATKGKKMPEWDNTRKSLLMRGIGNTFYGKKHTDESKMKISKANKGFKHTEEAKRKISEALKKRKRKPISEETRRKLSEARIGRKRKPFTEETLLKMSLAQKKRFK